MCKRACSIFDNLPGNIIYHRLVIKTVAQCMCYVVRLGRRELFDIQVAEVQPSDADVSPMARQSSGLRPQLRQQRRR